MNRIDDLVAEYGSGGVEFIPLKDIGTWYGGGTPSKQEPEFWSRGTIPWLSPKDMRQPVVSQTQDYITEAAVKHSATKLVPANSVALVVRSSILDHTLPIALVPVPITLNQDMKAVLPNDSVVPGYLAHLLRSLGPELLRTVRKTGGSVASLEYPKLLAQKVPVPPLAVQREIASILDEMEGVKAELESDLEFELEYRSRQFAFHRDQLLTFAEAGEVRWVPMGNVVDYTNGKAHERLVDADGDIPLVTARFISRNGEANRYVLAASVLTPALAGDVALVLSDLPRGRALARTFFVDQDNAHAINQRIARLRVRDASEVMPRFLFHVLNRNPGLLAHDNGVDQTHLSKGQVVGLPIPVPAMEDQERIVAILDTFDALVNDLSVSLPAEIAARRKQYEYYRDRLLTFKEAA